MTAANEQIVTAYEVERMAPAEIAESFEMDELVIKAILLQNSSAYRKAVKSQSTLDFTDEDTTEMMEIVKRLARYAEDEHLQARCAQYVIDVKKGFKNAGAAASRLNVSVNLIQQVNDQMKRALEAEARTIEAFRPKELVEETA
jgi:hypothetical protein